MWRYSELKSSSICMFTVYGALGSCITDTWQLLTCTLYLDICIVLTLFSNTPIQPKLMKGSLFHSFFSDWKEHFMLKSSKSKPMFENVIDLVYDWSIGAGLFNLLYFYSYINAKRLPVNICVIVSTNGVYQRLYI